MEDDSRRLIALQIELTSPRHPRIEVKRPGGQVLSIFIR
jgi:hypothetical protein